MQPASISSNQHADHNILRRIHLREFDWPFAVPQSTARCFERYRVLPSFHNRHLHHRESGSSQVDAFRRHWTSCINGRSRRNNVHTFRGSSQSTSRNRCSRISVCVQQLLRCWLARLVSFHQKMMPDTFADERSRFCVGMTWLYPAEITPLDIRAPANAISTTANWIFNVSCRSTIAYPETPANFS